MKINHAVLFFYILPCVGFAATIHVPANYPTIQQGIDMTINGDTMGTCESAITSMDRMSSSSYSYATTKP